MLFFTRNLYKQLYTMRSSNFEKQGKTEIGLQLVTRVLLPELISVYLGRLFLLIRYLKYVSE